MRKNRTKRVLAALLSALLLLSLTACGGHNSTDSQPDKDSPTVQQTDEQKQAANKQDKTKAEETGKGNTNTGETGKETSDKDTAGKDVSGSENSTKDDTRQEDNKTTSGSGSSNGSSPNGSSSGGGSSTGSSSGGGSAAGGSESSGGSTTGGSSSGGSASQPEPPASKDLTCTISISCSTILSNMDKCEESKKEWVPDNGVILPATTVTFTEGESVFDVLQRVCCDNGIQMEASWSGKYGSDYVEGIANIYEKNVGSTSGWMYKVNGWFPNYGCSSYTLSQGDVICWVYTCNLGDDVGGGYAT